MGFHQPPRPGPNGEIWRPVRYNSDGTQRGSLDAVEEARAARQKALSQARKRESEETDSIADSRPGSEAPVDILDGIVLALRAEPHRLHATDSHGLLTMDTPQAKRTRQRARLDAHQEAAVAALKKRADEKKAEKAEAEDEGYNPPWLSRTHEENDALIEQDGWDEDDDAFVEAGADDDFQWLREYDGTEKS